MITKYVFTKWVGSILLLALLIMPLTASATVQASGATVRATELRGELSSGYSAHYLAVEPAQRDGTITLTLRVDPKTDPRAASRVNLWVLSPEGLRALKEGEKPEHVAIAAGNPTVLDEDEHQADSGKKEASFKASGRQIYTVIVYSRASVSTNYTLVATSGMLIDGSGQTKAVDQASEQTKPADKAVEQSKPMEQNTAQPKPTEKPTEPTQNEDEAGGDE